MSAIDRLVTNFLTTGRQAAGLANEDEALRKRLAMSAVELVHLNALGSVMPFVQDQDASTREVLGEALEYAVEHPVLKTQDGKTYNARVFLIPVSQIVHNGIALQSLPAGETVEQLLRDALCPSGIGILLNRFVPLNVLEDLSLQELSDMSRAAAERVGLQSASEADLFVNVGPDIVSGLHMVVFIAMAPVRAADELLSLEGEDLALRTSAVMEVLHEIVESDAERQQHPGVGLCMHLPQPLFYDPVDIDLAHESFLCAASISQWFEEAEAEGRTLTLNLKLEHGQDVDDIVVSAVGDKEVIGEFRFAVDIDDMEMREELCLAVRELARLRGLEVQLQSPLTFGGSEASTADARLLQLMDTPLTLQ
jgi:hypothetical protein